MGRKKRLDGAFLKQVGLSLYVHRKIKGYSLSQITKDLDIHPQTFCAYENGKHEIDINTFYELSRRYGPSMNDIVRLNPLSKLSDLFDRAVKKRDKKEIERLSNIIHYVYMFMVSNNTGEVKYDSLWMDQIASIENKVSKYWSVNKKR